MHQEKPVINPDCALNTGPRGLGNKEQEGTLRFKLLLAKTCLGMSALLRTILARFL